MNSERELDLIWEAIHRIERKLDSLLSFRGWVLGVVATVSAGVSLFVTIWFKDR